MLQLPEVELDSIAHGGLKRYQKKIDAIPGYAEKVAKAKDSFSHSNRKENKTFAQVREALYGMCYGAKRCMYCEDSYADEVDHIQPKDFYPELTFVWESFVYACGPCNGPKNNMCAVFLHTDRSIQSISRGKNDPVEPPPEGDSLLINPREENPLNFMWLDLRDTFYFNPIFEAGTEEYQRARYTIDILHLNDRDALQAARKEAFGAYRDWLIAYITRRDQGATEGDLGQLVENLRRKGHPTVWQEMKRQQEHIPELRALFAQAPEALEW